MCLFELTERCPLRCVHCYIPLGKRRGKKKGGELSTAGVVSVLNQLRDLGCMFLVFSGGEAFLRPDIVILCESARSMNFDLRLFTNGVNMSEPHIKALSEMGVSGVEVSMYGPASVHDRITGVAGSHRRTVSGIELLLKYNVDVVVKSPVMNLNFKHYPWVISFCRRHGIPYKFDPVVVPANDGGREPLSYRLDKEQLESIFSDRRLLPDNSGTEDHVITGNTGLTNPLACSAGRNFVGISSDGTIYPCIQYRVMLGNVRESKLKDVWFSETAVRLRNIGIADINTCRECPEALSCRRCPGLALLEDGDMFGPSRVACELSEIQSGKTVNSASKIPCYCKAIMSS